MKKIFSVLFVAMLSVVTISAYPTRMYMIGDATSTGWSLDEAMLMESETEGVYEFVGDLNNGSLKFVPQKDWVPSFGPMENGTALAIGEHELSFRASYEDADNSFAVSAGRYALTLDLTGESMILRVADGTDIEDKGIFAYYPATIYPIGDATAAGWTPANAIEMIETATNSGVYTDTMNLQSGELKFLHQRDWGAAFGATMSGVVVNGAGEYDLQILGDEDNKFIVSLEEETTFIVTVNAVLGLLQLELTEPVVVYPEHLYMIGGAVGGWSWDDNAQEMIAGEEEGVFTWAGTLVADELKFFVEKDFSATAYGATEAGTVMSVDGIYSLEKLGAEDKKFIAPSGNVVLTVNLQDMTLKSEQEITSLNEVLVIDDTTSVYDLQGNCLMKEANDLNSLPAGVYILRGHNGTKKIIR